MTRWSAVACRRPARGALIVGLAFGLMASVGCGNQAGPEDAAAVEQEAVINPAAAELPPPATDRIDYDSRTRTLTFYDLPESARWMVRKPHTLLADSVGPDHRLPEGIDPEHTFVFYRRPGGQQSRAVSLAQIQAARQMHDSLRD
jgi:hypothetical protein